MFPLGLTKATEPGTPGDTVGAGPGTRKSSVAAGLPAAIISEGARVVGGVGTLAGVLPSGNPELVGASESRGASSEDGDELGGSEVEATVVAAAESDVPEAESSFLDLPQEAPRTRSAHKPATTTRCLGIRMLRMVAISLRTVLAYRGLIDLIRARAGERCGPRSADGCRRAG